VTKLVDVWARTQNLRADGGVDRPDRLAAVLRLTGIPFTKQHIDDFRHAETTFKRSVHLKG